MAMVDRIIALPEGVSAEDWRKQSVAEGMDPWGDDLMGAEEIVDDSVFRDEKLHTWCQLMQSDWLDDEVAVLKPHHVKSAKEDLQVMVDRVSAMPFTSDEGSEENLAILREVKKVLLKAGHFNYPWQADRKFGVPRMIEALDKVQAFMDANPDRAVLLLSY